LKLTKSVETASDAKFHVIGLVLHRFCASAPLEEHLEEIIRLVGDLRSSLRRLTLDGSCTIDVFVGWTPPWGQSILRLAPESFEVLASTGAALIFDMYGPDEA